MYGFPPAQLPVYEPLLNEEPYKLKFSGADCFILNSTAGGTILFVSIDSTFINLLPQKTKLNYASGLQAEQASTYFPFAPVISGKILNMLDFGYPETTPVVLRLPGKDRSDLQPGILYSGGNNPSELIPSSEIFGESDKFYPARINANDYLKLRLIDIFLGDYVSSPKDLFWRGSTAGGITTFTPFPGLRLRDFCRIGGLLNFGLSFVYTDFLSFDRIYPPVDDLIFSMRETDRKILPLVSKAEWDSVTAFVKNRLTDKVIGDAVNSLPEGIDAERCKEISSALLSRRDKLTGISNDYYFEINRIREIFLPDDNSSVLEIDPLSPAVTVKRHYGKDKSKLRISGRFKINTSITDEVRLFLSPGNDTVIVKGGGGFKPVYKIVSESGNDLIIDSTKKGNGGGFGGFQVYSDNDTLTIINNGGLIKYEYQKAPGSTLNPRHIKDTGYDILFYPLLNASRDLGIYIGGGPMLVGYDFGVYPYKYKAMIAAAYASRPNSYELLFHGEINSFFPSLSAELSVRKTGKMLNHYFGYGNETPFDNTLFNNDFYQVAQKFFIAGARINYHLSGNAKFSAGFEYSGTENKFDNPVNLSSFPDSAYGLGLFKMLSVQEAFTYDTRDFADDPESGFLFKLRHAFYPDMLSNGNVFHSADIEFASYFRAELLTDHTLIFKAGGGKLWGAYPFFKSQMLGGETDLPGFRQSRFAGDASVYFLAEAESFISPINIIFRGNFGSTVFASAGRVFTGARSFKWHPSAGIGFWVNYLNRRAGVKATMAVSKENVLFYLTTVLSF